MKVKKSSKASSEKTSDNKIKTDLDSLFKTKKGVKKASVVEKEKKDKEKEEADKVKAALDLRKSEVKKGSTRKFTTEGYPIFNMDELKMGKGGDTPDCPFDC